MTQTIIHVTTSWPRPGAPGAGGFVADLVAAQRAAGVDARVVHPGGAHSVLGDLRSPRRWPRLARTLWQLRRDVRLALRASEGAIVHAHWWPCAVLARSAGARTIVTTVHGSDADLLRLPLARRLGRHAIRSSAVVIAPSRYLAGIVAQRTGADVVAIRIVPHGDDVTDTGPSPAERSTLVYAGPLAQHKGVDLVPSILRSARAEGCSLVLHVYGAGPLESFLHTELASELSAGTVVLHGMVDHETVIDALAHAAVVICPSRFEGYGLVCQEARHRGAAVAAFAVGGLAEQLADQPAAALVAPEDAVALGAAVAALAADTATRVEHWQSLRSGVAVRSWSDVAAETIAIYGAVAPRN